MYIDDTIITPQVKKIKAIYHTMNMFNLDVTQRCLIAECWCPVEELDEIQRALTRGTVSVGGRRIVGMGERTNVYGIFEQCNVMEVSKNYCLLGPIMVF